MIMKILGRATYLALGAALAITISRQANALPFFDQNISMFPKPCGNIEPFELCNTSAYTLEKKGSEYHVYLSDSFNNNGDYKDLARGLRQLTSLDSLTFHIANFGGSVHAGILVINAIKASNATTKSIIESPSYSMAALLACSTDKLEIEQFSFLMFHDYSGGLTGKGSEARAFHENFGVIADRLLNRECVSKGILTHDQARDITRGVDVYVFDEDLK